MAKLSLMVKAERGSKFPVRNYTRCKACGRPRAYIGKFQLCRICFTPHGHIKSYPLSLPPHGQRHKPALRT